MPIVQVSLFQPVSGYVYGMIIPAGRNVFVCVPIKPVVLEIAERIDLDALLEAEADADGFIAFPTEEGAQEFMGVTYELLSADISFENRAAMSALVFEKNGGFTVDYDGMGGA